MYNRISFRDFVGPVLSMLVLGWGGLLLMIFVLKMPPLVWARWTFFVLGILALTGTALPIVFLAHDRFPSHPPVEPNVITRQALWVGVYGATLAWLQLGHLVSLYVVLGLAAGLGAVEYFIGLRERARWRPPDAEPDDDAA
ncbi:MAG TPA: hypothetical protein VGJ22_08780 [Anaerolineales bacterium]